MKQLTQQNRICRNVAKLKCSGMGNNVSDFERFNTLQNKLNSLIVKSNHCYEVSQSKYFIGQFHCSTLTSLLTSKNVSWITPIFWQNTFITKIRQKSESFNSFLANHFLSINNNSKIATDSFLWKINLCPMLLLLQMTLWNLSISYI